MNMELLNYALAILANRAKDVDNRYLRGERIAYNSALSIITAALENNEEVLKEYDY